ncbi:hypothetical protein KJY73_11030 [Bowmanella sp. Y26]|uniref:Response regulatory domain-containing protein n=1 Tax=Bowmanella yangjiangensis TaxID=2811230 RepID=A0ABS3CUN8_9ALTE|nr:hypothetical protein [Bowmanella yangjiangensis]MBN7820805.1 hypothetical protein [Bowmanella yangjiangensis]MBT1064111.1 hypothetical protein [Bowmanella yangjiangensis]
MPLRILLIEPDATLKKDLALVLQSTGGYEVETLDSPQQATPLLISRPFAVLLGKQPALSNMPASMLKIGYGTYRSPPPEHCLGWIEHWQPLPGFAERVRLLLEG